MDNERQIILEMLAEGKIDATKAAELLEAISEGEAREEAPARAAEPSSETTPPPVASIASIHKAYAPEDIGREIADKIDEIVSVSVDKSVDFAGRFADQAVRGALALTDRLKSKRLEEKIRRKTERLMSRLDRVQSRHTRRTGSPIESTVLRSWLDQMESLFAKFGSGSSAEVEAALDSLSDLTQDLTEAIAEAQSHLSQVTATASLEQGSEALDEALDHIHEATSVAHKMEGEIARLQNASMRSGNPALEQAANEAMASWHSAISTMEGAEARASSARQEALAALRQAAALLRSIW